MDGRRLEMLFVKCGTLLVLQQSILEKLYVPVFGVYGIATRDPFYSSRALRTRMGKRP